MKPYIQVALFFALTQLLGIYTGVILVNGAVSNPDIQALSVAPIAQQFHPRHQLYSSRSRFQC
ncbi:MAG: hypothetical protein NTV88_00360 [Candidatus Micrarchaeota archaeon]|nr:hypothetical protein [Candidatus Micrarchaeota archaeon]